MKNVVYHCPYVHGPGAIKWIVASWSEGFRRRGYEFHVSQDDRQMQSLWAKFHPEILFCDIVSTRVEDAGVRAFLARVRAAGTRVVLNLFWPLVAQPTARADALRSFDLADVYCGEKEEDAMRAFTQECGKIYSTMPHSANPRFHFPTAPNPRYAYDVVFLGARLPHKRWFNENVIPAVKKDFNLGLFGPQWTLRDNALRTLSKAAKTIGRPSIARMIDRFRVYLPEEDENGLYASAKICLNFHEREPDNFQSHKVVNQRTYKIAACGGFQIVDPVEALPRYFGANEIVTAGFDRREWIEKIAYFIEHEEERKTIQARATRRALADHMAQNRVDLLERLMAASRRP